MHALIFANLVLFLSTLSLRRATIREPRESRETLHFYPRSPCGERLNINRPTVTIMQFLSTLSLRRATVWHRLRVIFHIKFLSTLSLRRATQAHGGGQHRDMISIHALLAESDWAAITLREVLEYFYPRSPCGERPKPSGCCV